MDIAPTLLQLFQALPPALQGYILLALLIVAGVSHFVLPWTRTLPPNTLAGRFYTGLEMIGGLYGRAKDIGVPVPTVTDIVNSLTAHLKSGQPITADNLPQVLGLSVPPMSQAQPAPNPTSPNPAVMLLLIAGLGMALGLSACSSADTGALVTQISQDMAKANAATADLSADLPKVCIGVDAANLAFQGAALFDQVSGLDNITPDIQSTEAKVYATLTGPTGICSAANRANPPADVAQAARAAVQQVMAFLPAALVAEIKSATAQAVAPTVSVTAVPAAP